MVAQEPQLKPTPDPTVLTTEQLQREVSTINRELELRKASSLREMLSLEELVKTLINGLDHVMSEKFVSIATTFELIEKQRVEQKKDTKDAVDAALTAQKEAVKEQTTAFGLATAKSEAAMTEQLKQLNATFTAAIKGVTDLLNDTKDRISKMEAMRLGGEGAVNNRRADTAIMIASVGGLVAAGSAIYNAVRG